jgi:BASS family bile acid:Na+ symporter
MALPYWLGFGMQHGQKIVLSIGMPTRNLGAAIAPLFSVAEVDQRAFVMVVLGLPLMVVFAFLAVKWFGRRGAGGQSDPVIAHSQAR